MNFTIKEEVFNQIEVSKSKFISFVFPVSSLEEFNDKLKILKKEHPKARHFCSAYIIGKNKRGNDDGEPKGTAGIPLLTALEKNNLTNVAVIIIRYFGGTLLGAGRLLRTYVDAFEEAYKKAILIELKEVSLIEVNVDYDCLSIFENYLKKNHFIIIKKEFNDKIYISFLTPLNFEIDYFSLFLGKVNKINESIYLYRKEI